jgi:pimeloyl-ACP methyl ester carboxylesterase
MLLCEEINLGKFAIILGLIITVVSPAIVAEGEDWITPPGQLIDMGGFKLHIYCEGNGTGPAVIMDSGIGGFSLEWVPVQRILSAQTRVCAYDRAGYGWSDPGPSPRTTDQIVEELHTLLQEAGVTPPYVLVGHSFGGFNMQYFAKIYPQETAGLILVDSSHPEQVDRLPEIPAVREKSRTKEVVTYFQGQTTLGLYPEDVRYKAMRILSLRKMYQTYRRESVNFAISGEQVSAAGLLPDIPLVVITRGKRVWPDDPYGQMLESIWQEMQKEMAGFSPNGIQIIAADSGHLIQLEQPDVVALGISSVLEATRNPVSVQLND